VALENNPFVEFGQRFLDANIRGVEIHGLETLLQEFYDEAEMPIQVASRKGKIYLIRKDWQRNGEVVSEEDSGDVVGGNEG
jgi:hypothetical protein